MSEKKKVILLSTRFFEMPEIHALKLKLGETGIGAFLRILCQLGKAEGRILLVSGLAERLPSVPMGVIREVLKHPGLFAFTADKSQFYTIFPGVIFPDAETDADAEKV